MQHTFSDIRPVFTGDLIMQAGAILSYIIYLHRRNSDNRLFILQSEILLSTPAFLQSARDFRHCYGTEK